MVDMSKAAVETRREREAEEGGRRQAQENLRARQDQMYEQSMRVHHSTSESYMENVIEKQTDEIAHEQAVSEIVAEKEAKERQEAAGGGAAGAGQPAEEVVGELVAGFLLPGVERHRVRQEVQLEERRFVDAAHTSMAESVEDSQGPGHK